MQASAVLFTNLNGNSVTINWTNGNGSQRIVVMRAGAPVNFNPSDLALYSANNIFGNGTPQAVDNYVVFHGAAAVVNVTGLQPNTSYHVAVYEFNGSGTPVYRVADAPVGNFTTAARPTVPASAIFF